MQEIEREIVAENGKLKQHTKNASGGAERSSSIELFRIITMILIVAHHYVVNSGLSSIIAENPLCARSIFLLLFGAWGKIGINCFVMITGYFMCKSHITARKFLKLLFEIEFYRIIIWFIFFVTGYEAFSFSGFVKMILPVREIASNFSGCYIVFYLTIPFLNCLLRHIKEKQHLLLILLCVFTYVLVGSVPVFSVSMNYVSWFIVLYFIASYFRLYPKKIFESVKIWAWAAIGAMVICIASVICMTLIGVKFGISTGYSYYWVNDSNKILALAAGICTFMFFKNLKLKYSKIINTIAASTFGVLLIHANSDTMRQWLWKDFLDNVGHYNSNLLVVHAVGSVLCIFVVCVAIDYLRIKFIEKPVFRIWDKHWGKLASAYYDAEQKILSKFGVEN